MSRSKNKAQKILESYNWLKQDTVELCLQRRAIEQEESLPSGIDYSADRVQTSPDDGMLRKVLRIQERTADIDRRIVAQTKAVEAIDNALNDMPNKKFKKLLTLKYIDRRGWNYTARVLNYSVDHAKGYMHRYALNMFMENYKG